MNNMADHLVWRGSGPTDDEKVVNTMPFQGQSRGSPEWAFREQVRRDCASQVARTTSTTGSSV
jgi:hypothetical protein